MMANKQEKREKKCLACKTILVEDGKLGLCPNCINKYGTPAAAFLVLGLTFAGRQVIKNGGKIVKTAVNIVKNIK